MTEGIVKKIFWPSPTWAQENTQEAVAFRILRTLLATIALIGTVIALYLLVRHCMTQLGGKVLMEQAWKWLTGSAEKISALAGGLALWMIVLFSLQACRELREIEKRDEEFTIEDDKKPGRPYSQVEQKEKKVIASDSQFSSAINNYKLSDIPLYPDDSNEDDFVEPIERCEIWKKKVYENGKLKKKDLNEKSSGEYTSEDSSHHDN